MPEESKQIGQKYIAVGADTFEKMSAIKRKDESWNKFFKRFVLGCAAEVE
jgi:hypothetical protein